MANNDEYVVYINSRSRHTSSAYTNSISTSKYTWYNFIPKILVEQFSKMANIYFLIIAIMQSIHEISISGGKPVILLPLTIVVFVNGIKDFFEDWKRKKSDDEENSRSTMILNSSTKKFEEKRWMDIRNGDVIRVDEDQNFPADLIFISSSSNDGICYVETKNLDGETNLKYKQAIGQLNAYYKSAKELLTLSGTIACEPPNEFIYTFNGKLCIGESEASEKIVVDKNSFLLRGCSLKQTKYIYGIAVYIGEHTKVMKNSPSAKSKTSRLENVMNYQILIVLCVQLTLSSFGALMYLKQYYDNESSLLVYIFQGAYAVENANMPVIRVFLARMGTWVLIFTNFVPISLLVTLEMVKYTQGMFMAWDIHMYDKKTKTSVKVQTSTLNEELGQVKFIFSDKTGTLTKNNMVYKCMSIGDSVYGLEELGKNQAQRLFDTKGEITNVLYQDLSIFDNMKDKSKSDTIDKFMLCLSLCHTVITYNKDESSLTYQASSPDELALVNGARYFKYTFCNRDSHGNIYLDVKGDIQEFKLLDLLEYTSERKRMSVIVESNGRKMLYTKGADSVILERLSSRSEHVDFTRESLYSFSTKGLRTLVVACKELDEGVYNTWRKKYDTVNDQINNPNPERRQTNLNLLYDEIEKDLTLLGATAIDDQLQDNVPETIESFVNAGIHVWVLTGDKVDTAKSIAFSSRLLTHEFTLFEFPEHSRKDEISNLLDEYSVAIRNQAMDSKFGLIICSEEIDFVMRDPLLVQKFYNLSISCNSVLCCRTSPKQKSEIVLLVKLRQPDLTTLAIGDGANDVNMITSAHIGIGILGVEGRQASRASDYAIGEFSFLRRLLFVHGRECYRKNAYIVVYNFYKNALFVMPQFWFGFESFYSGQTLYDPWIYQLYNTIFTCLPIIWFGINDKEYKYKELYADSKYYVQGIVNKLFHTKRFWKWVLYGMMEGFLIFLIGFYANNSINQSGESQDLWSIGSICYSAIVLSVNFKLFFSTSNHTLISIFLILVSVSSYFFVLLLMSKFYRFENFNNFKMILTSANFYLSTLLVVTIVLIVDNSIRRLLYLFNYYEDPTKIKPKSIEGNLLLEKKVMDKNTYLGAAFSQEPGQSPQLIIN